MLAINQFIEYLGVEKRYSAYTTLNYERDLQEFCSFLGVTKETLDPTVVTTDDVRMWVVAMLEKGQSPRTVRRKVSALRSFFKFLLKMGLVKTDVTRVVITPKIDKPLPVFFKESEMQRATAGMEYADDYPSVRDGLIIEMLYETGMRQAEMLGLNDGDIDMGQKQIRVFGKRRKERIVPFGDHLAGMIEQYWSYRNEQFGVERHAAQAFLLSNGGERLTKSRLYNIVRSRMGEVSTQKKHSPHVLRHTFATTMLNEGADINTIKTLLGHASLAATQVYTHTTFEQMKAAYRKAHPRATGKSE